MRRRARYGYFLTVAVAMLAGCASQPAAGPTGAEPSPSTSSCAVPAQEGVEPPPGCIAYDPEAGMRSNDMYRERMEISAAAEEAGNRIAVSASAALQELRESGAQLDEATLRSALAQAGLSDSSIEMRGDDATLLFGATYGTPGESTASCVYGAVSGDAVTIEVGGLIMDGGCLPAQ